ncbi:partner and localizer of BRCA2-like isoform X2 [Bufo gargarizans]|uniref:partner and localizer of BRCA2-like isoform X2 n=1 Tax=Bufo gargarizans TaxID=30331 RepID=UPI001CF48187|nr:partner and localizer of BRCA2-like isoform X2 [Bufo gargarizans]
MEEVTAAAAACDMENAPEKPLTLEEKTKLKERLALLKKEYKKTVHRLQRSQRAQRVKTHVKKTIEEQNRLLSQELSIQDSVFILAGSLVDASNASRKATESTQSIVTPSAERKPSVSFNLDPEILHCDKKSPSWSGSESSCQELSVASKTETTGLSNPNQGKRSRLKLNRRQAFSEAISPRVQVNSSASNLEEKRNINEVETTRDSALCLTADDTPQINEATFNSESTRCVQVTPECENDLGVNVLVQQHNNMGATSSPASPVFTKCLKEDIKLSSEHIAYLYPGEKVTLDTGQPKVATEHSQDRSRNNRMHRGKEPAHSHTNIQQRLTSEQISSVTKLLGDTSQDLTLDATCNFPPIPYIMETSSTSPPCSENHSVPTAKYHGEPSGFKEECSPLDSCTLVEGLLFPVEYYVRTTRRMTSCQRKVDLEAVINSHLGMARKGAKSGPRRASTSLTPSLQVSGASLSIPSHSAARSRRVRGRKSCPASVSSGLDNISKKLTFGSSTSPIADGFQGVKETIEAKELCIETCAEGLKKLEDVTLPSEGRRRTPDDGNLGLHALPNNTNILQRCVYNLRTSAKTSEPSSPFFLFSSGLNLKHLMGHVDITDFHLPDEDFGVLKLEKLKSASQLDPRSTNEKERYRGAYSIDGSTRPVGDYSALLHGAVGGCTDASQRNSKLTLEGCPNDNQSQRDGTTSYIFLTRATPEVFHLSPSKEKTCAPGCPVSCPLQQAPLGSYSNVDVSKHFSDPELGTPAPNANCVETSSTNMESAIAGPSEPPPSVLSPTKEVACSVLLSTSMCSVPVDTHGECRLSGCTPGFPMLGPTPAVFSSPQCSTIPAPCEDRTPTRTVEFPPEEDLVTQDDVETDPYSELLIPPSGDHVCIEKKACSHPGHETNESDQHNMEGMLEGDHIHLVSEIKDTCGGGCPVDLCSVWWEFSGCVDLCIVSANEFSVCLWRPQEVFIWKCVHTWSFSEMPVIQILPLFQEKNMVCIALGNLDIMEIWVLSSHPELQTWEKQLVKRGHTKTAQGLSRHRVVSSSGGGGSQAVELWQLSESGSVAGSHALVAPNDSIVAFSEVDGERDALVGSTVDNNLVLWNSVTGHLLSTFYIGNLCSDLTCISAASDSGLLFLVVGSLFSKSCEVTGSCIFKLIATNPQGGASAFIMAYKLPEGLSSRYLEGDVKNQRAAAVLTCGSIALWDLSRSHCSAVLPPDPDTPWCLVRWGNRPSCLLAGRKDGTICIFEYSDRS